MAKRKTVARASTAEPPAAAKAAASSSTASSSTPAAASPARGGATKVAPTLPTRASARVASSSAPAPAPAATSTRSTRGGGAAAKAATAEKEEPPKVAAATAAKKPKVEKKAEEPAAPLKRGGKKAEEPPKDAEVVATTTAEAPAPAPAAPATTAPPKPAGTSPPRAAPVAVPPASAVATAAAMSQMFPMMPGSPPPAGTTAATPQTGIAYTDQDILLPTTTEQIAARPSNREYIQLLQANCAIYHSLPSNEQVWMLNNVCHFLTAVRKHRLVHFHPFAGWRVLTEPLPLMVAELNLDTFKRAAFRFHPLWLLGEHDPSGYHKGTPFIHRKVNGAWRRTSLEDVRVILQGEGPKNLLLLPTGMDFQDSDSLTNEEAAAAAAAAAAESDKKAEEEEEEKPAVVEATSV